MIMMMMMKKLAVQRRKTGRSESRIWGTFYALGIAHMPFYKAKREEKHYRVLLLLCTSWCRETVDLIGKAISYKSRYFKITDIVDRVHCQYEPHADELDDDVYSRYRQSK